MSQDQEDEFKFKVSGALIALRVVISAILRTHPNPEEIISTIQEILKLPGALDGQLPAPIQSAFDEQLQEMLLPLYEKTRNKEN